MQNYYRYGQLENFSEMSTQRSGSLLKRHLECTANYNKEMEENGLRTLGKRREGGAPEDALRADIDSMIDTQKKVDIHHILSIIKAREDLFF